MHNSCVYILAGGNDLRTQGYGPRLQKVITQWTSRPRILSCFFAAPEEIWGVQYEKWHTWFQDHFGPEIDYSYAKLDSFVSQIKNADVIYLHGGDTQLLFETLAHYKPLDQYFDSKIVVGSSAGANVLAKNYWSSSQAKPGRGFGVLDVNIMVHYGTPSRADRTRTPQDWWREEAVFQKQLGSSAMIMHIPEGQFVVLQRTS